MESLLNDLHWAENGSLVSRRTYKEQPRASDRYFETWRWRKKKPEPKFRLHTPLNLLRRPPPLTMNSLKNYYLPAAGALSYQALSMHLVHKKLFAKFFGDRDLSIVNCLLYTSHIGLGLYLYNSPPVCFAASYNRLMYSVFGSVLFNFGSLLLWSTLRNAVQTFHPGVKILLALSCATTLLFVGADYVNFLNAWLREKLEKSQKLSQNVTLSLRSRDFALELTVLIIYGVQTICEFLSNHLPWESVALYVFSDAYRLVFPPGQPKLLWDSISRPDISLLVLEEEEGCSADPSGRFLSLLGAVRAGSLKCQKNAAVIVFTEFIHDTEAMKVLRTYPKGHQLERFLPVLSTTPVILIDIVEGLAPETSAPTSDSLFKFLLENYQTTKLHTLRSGCSVRLKQLCDRISKEIYAPWKGFLHFGPSGMEPVCIFPNPWGLRGARRHEKCPPTVYVTDRIEDTVVEENCGWILPVLAVPALWRTPNGYNLLAVVEKTRPWDLTETKSWEPLLEELWKKFGTEKRRSCGRSLLGRAGVRVTLLEDIGVCGAVSEAIIDAMGRWIFALDYATGPGDQPRGHRKTEAKRSSEVSAVVDSHSPSKRQRMEASFWKAVELYQMKCSLKRANLVDGIPTSRNSKPDRDIEIVKKNAALSSQTGLLKLNHTTNLIKPPQPKVYMGEPTCSAKAYRGSATGEPAEPSTSRQMYLSGVSGPTEDPDKEFRSFNRFKSACIAPSRAVDSIIVDKPVVLVSAMSICPRSSEAPAAPEASSANQRWSRALPFGATYRPRAENGYMPFPLRMPTFPFPEYLRVPYFHLGPPIPYVPRGRPFLLNPMLLNRFWRPRGPFSNPL